ncbi:MAG: AAA family ATPase [Bacteroidales bacterium]|nr:AAA family ATPase [Bacteroidales bacterium]
MLEWKRESEGQTALLIEGPRRVGKSTIVKVFAQKEYKSHLIIDFANTSDEIKSLFGNLSDIDTFFSHLKIFTGKTLHKRESVIVFDEVQMCPQARQAIKYLVADGRYDYIETGSLISIRKNVENIVIPSEEEAIRMHPLDFEEFCWANDDTETFPFLREALSQKKPLSDAINRKVMRDFRTYMLVGGMPQAVSKYVETKDFAKVDRVKRTIIRLYEQDFQKIDKTGKAAAIFKAIPSELHKNSSRFQLSAIGESAKSQTISNVVSMMEDSHTVNVAFHADDPNVGLELGSNKAAWKMYLCDTGLFVTLAFWDKKFTENIIYKKLLNDTLESNMGYVYENVVAQMLAASGNKLFYYTWAAPGNHVYEVDFLLSRGFKLFPVEVKSSGYATHKSLDVFCTKYSKRVSNRYLIYTKDLRKDHETLMVPVYMVGLL